jgi:large subunit ribosomal protein L21
VKPLKIGSIVAAVAAAAVGAAVLLKDRLFPAEAPAGAPAPAPAPDPEPPDPPAPAPAADDDLTSIKGIGPVYRARLNESGVTTFAELAAADATEVAEQIEVPEARVAVWIEQAAQFVTG